ncbi:MAG TPA: replication-associated recombination protein A [Bacilli bacterium]|nr:replication-associated recombination protein A [Bacilli bacterium]
MKTPLAFRMRPQYLDEIIGQKHLVGPLGFLTSAVENDMPVSIILFGPPGSGKTTIAEAFARSIKAHIILLNAVTSKKKQIEEAIEASNFYPRVIVVMDEVHRLNKDKQDLLLPAIESGQIYLIGATTANPYLAINPAIRSRCHLLEVEALSVDELVIGLKRAVSSFNGLDSKINLTEDAYALIAKTSGGDLRFAYNMLEVLSLNENKNIDATIVKSVHKIPNYIIDRDEGGHYDAVSAMQKSIRGSDIDASLYYLARLIAGGDLEGIARRLLVTAYEDIGLANPPAVDRVYHAIQVAREVGFPEATIPLGFAVCELALSPKSKAAHDAIFRALDKVEEMPLAPLDYLKLTPVNVKEEDKYPYNRPELWEKMQYLPELIKDEHFYIPQNTSKFEQSLNSNHARLDKIKRTSNLARLKNNRD